MLVANKSDYNNNIYYGIVVNTDSSDDPNENASDRVQIYIPSMQYEYNDKYEAYMNSSNKTTEEDFNVYPWASTLKKDLKVGDEIYGSFINNDSGQYIVLGQAGGISTASKNNKTDDNNDNENGGGNTNDLSNSDLLDLIMPIILRYEVGLTDLSAWGKNNIPDSYYQNITLHDGDSTNCWAIGLIQWNGADAFDIMYRCCKASGDKWKDDLPSNETLYKALKSAISSSKPSKYRGNFAKNYNPTEGSNLYKGIKKILAYKTSKQAQREYAKEYTGKTVTMLQNAGVDNPAILIYLADLMNQYGTGLSETKKVAVNACKETKKNYMQQLDLVVKKVKTFATYKDYETRRTGVYNYIKNLYNKGKLTSDLTKKSNSKDSPYIGTYRLPFDKLYDVSFKYHQIYKKTGKPHRGVDFRCPSGTKLYACTDGTIDSYDSNKGTTYAGNSKNDTYWYGHFCVIHADDGNHILYGHMKETAGKKGKIKKGDYIGKSDNTGNSFGAHLHFEVRKSKTYGTEIDPMPYLGLDSSGNKLPSSKNGTELVKLARKYVGKSTYVYGAKPSQAPDIVDCSSFTQYLYGQYGYSLKRVSSEQAQYNGTPVDIKNLQAGDLLFFKTIEPKEKRYLNITHVAIYNGNGGMIHAANSKSGVVETESILKKGDYYYVKGSRFKCARRIFK